MDRLLPFLPFILVAAMLFGWKEYESYIIETEKNKRAVSFNVPNDPSPVTFNRKFQLEQMALAERSKVKVMVEHDNSPLTDTYPYDNGCY